MQTKRKTLLQLCITVALLIFLPLTNQISVPENNSLTSTIKSSGDSSGGNQPNEALSINNASQYNISEYSLYVANKTGLRIEDENLTMGIPENWDVTDLTLNVSSVYETMEIFGENGLNGDFSGSFDPWDTYTTYPYKGTELGNYAMFEYLSSEERARATYKAGILGFPDDYIGTANTSANIGKSSANLEIGELIEEEQSLPPSDMYGMPMDNEFWDNPKWDVLIDPYGGYKASSEVEGKWIAGIDALRQNIDAKWSLLYEYGSPSVAHYTPFDIPFEADSVTITYKWRVINQGYEANDTFMVVSTIDGELVDGTIDIDGYNHSADTGDRPLLEFDGELPDYTPDISSHDYYERTFNITDLIGDYGYRKGYHDLSFGIFLQSPDEANDDVQIEWDYIMINATHYDWYKAAQFHVDLLWEELEDFHGGGLAFSMYIGELGTENFLRYFIGYSSQFEKGSDWDNDHFHLPVEIPHLYKKAFEVDNFSFYIGMEYGGPLAGSEELLKDAKGRITVDNLELWVNYDLGPPDALGLEMRLNDGKGWRAVQQSQEIHTLITEPELNIGFNISGVSDPYIRLYTYIFSTKFSEDQAESSVSIDRFYETQSFWNTTYNNTQSFDEANATLSNAIFLAYYLRFENLPAFDGLGSSSVDWDIYRALRPNRLEASHRAEKTSDDPYLQNVTISYSTWGVNTTSLRGVWQLHSHQENYLTNGTMCLDGGVSSEKLYNNDAAEYQLEFRNTSELYGNYQIALYNSTFNMSSNFPKYHTGVDNNEAFDWIVLDEGVGTYFMYSLWNDTDGSNQTKRFGWYFDTFAMWRHVESEVLEYPAGLQVVSGDLAIYNVQFNQTSVGNTGIDRASFDAFNNGTGNPWGVDWPPYTYLLHGVIDFGNGTYKLYLKTVGVPLISHRIHFSIFAPYHDRIDFTDAPYLNITGTTSTMSISYLSGAFEYDNDKVNLTSDNIPYVNDTSNSKIEVLLEDSGPIRDAYISASVYEFSESALMVAVEKYSITFAESDKGIYILTLDTTSLNVTTTSNYTLIVSYFRTGYFTEVHNVSLEVDPIPLVINPEVINPNYELEDITIQASSFINNSGSLDPYQDISMFYSIYNSGDEYQYGGSLFHAISNVFEVNIPLVGSQYLAPGNYTAILNGTGTNLAPASTNEIEFEIFAKYVTQLNVTLPSEVRIGSYFSIFSKLEYANLTGIANEQIELTINYSATYSYQVFVDTDSTGKASYDLLIPEYYEGDTLTVYAQYFGTEVLNASDSFLQKVILGKIPVNITFTGIPSLLQVGYNASWEAQLSILYEQDYEGKILTLYGFYDFDGNFSQPFLIRELSTDNNGTVSYTLDEVDDGHNNVSIYFEFQGDISVEDEYESVLGDIVPKWNSNFTLVDFPNEMRLGQTIPIELTLFSNDVGFTESFAVMPITIEFDYGTLKQDFLYYTDENGSLYYEVQIPDSGVTTLTYSISFPGTTKIESFTISNTTAIGEKLTTLIELESPSLLGTQRAGTFAYSATLTDSLGNPVANATVNFVVYDENDIPIYTYSSTTNNEGIAAISIPLETTGTFSITAEFVGEGIYAVATSAEASIEVVSNVMYYVRMLPYIGGGLAAVIAVGFIYQYAVVVPKRKRRLSSLKEIHQRFSDVENIQYILILTKAGLSVFSRSFTSVPIEETLISGFLTAISSFGAEIGTKMKQDATGEKGLEQLSYKQFKIIVDDAAISRTALLLLKDASPTLKERLHRFNLRFQEKYMDILTDFSGEIPAEGPILEMVEQFMEVDLLYPHNINTAKLDEFRKSLDKKSVNRKILEEGHQAPYHDTFYIRDMMNHLRETGEEDIHIFNGIIELRDEKAVFAINPRTRELIDQFKPIVDQLSDDAQNILLSIFHGVKFESQLRKTKGVVNYDQGVATLLQMGMINNDLTITPTGEAIATILRLV